MVTWIDLQYFPSVNPFSCAPPLKTKLNCCLLDKTFSGPHNGIGLCLSLNPHRMLFVLFPASNLGYLCTGLSSPEDLKLGFGLGFSIFVCVVFLGILQFWYADTRLYLNWAILLNFNFYPLFFWILLDDTERHLQNTYFLNFFNRDADS